MSLLHSSRKTVGEFPSFVLLLASNIRFWTVHPYGKPSTHSSIRTPIYPFIHLSELRMTCFFYEPAWLHRLYRNSTYCIRLSSILTISLCLSLFRCSVFLLRRHNEYR